MRSSFSRPQIATWLLACGLLSSCAQEEKRAPLASDGYDDESVEQTEDPNSDLIIDNGSTSLFCSETSVELPIVRHNFYFIVDASGSMSEIMPGSGGQSRHWAARHAIATMLQDVGHRVNFGAAVFPAPEGEDGCAAGAEVFSVRAGDEDEQGGLSRTQLDALLFTLGKHSPDGSTPVSPTLSALRSSLLELGPKTHVFLLTDGAPNCDLVSGCSAEHCIANIEGYSLGNGVNCDESLNCCSVDLFPHLCLDDENTLDELEKLREAGVDTYVVGIPGSEVYAGILDEMANAAGTPQGDAGTDYYRVDDVEELAATLTELGEELALDCEIELGAEPDRPTAVNVLAEDEVLELDEDWEWTSDTSVTLIGDACDQWRRGRWEQIRVVEGCEVRVR